MSMDPVKLRLRSLQYLPFASDGITLLSFASLVAKIEKPSASRLYKVTVILDMPNGFLVPLYEADITSNTIPLDVVAVVDNFNEDNEDGWKALLSDYVQRQSLAALERLRDATADIEKWVNFSAILN